MATLSEPGVTMTFVSGITIQVSSDTNKIDGHAKKLENSHVPDKKSNIVTIPVSSRLKLVTGETASDFKNLIEIPTVQYWG